MDKNTIEMAHKTNIERLLEEFGDDHEDEINRAYNTQRSFEESGAKIRDFIPIFTYRTVKELLLKDINVLKDISGFEIQNNFKI